MMKPIPKSALRYDSNKPRFDLIPVRPMFELAKVFTKGAEKYAEHNWRKGMQWSRMIGSMERHLQKFKNGEDLDEELQTHHLAMVAWNALCLLEYCYTHPELDDRPKDQAKYKGSK